MKSSAVSVEGAIPQISLRADGGLADGMITRRVNGKACVVVVRCSLSTRMMPYVNVPYAPPCCLPWPSEYVLQQTYIGNDLLSTGY